MRVSIAARVPRLDLRTRIRDVPDFPKPGIVFKDIMPLLADAAALHQAVDDLAEWAQPRNVDIVVGAEARGFILGAAVAYKLGCGFVAARKPGKLPYLTVGAKYALEYGFDALEMHVDALMKGRACADPRRPARHRAAPRGRRSTSSSSSAPRSSGSPSWSS